MIICLHYFVPWINVIRSLLVSMDIRSPLKTRDHGCLFQAVSHSQGRHPSERMRTFPEPGQCGWVQVVSRVELGLFRALTAANLVFFFFWLEREVSVMNTSSFFPRKRCRHSRAVFWILTWRFSVEMPLLRKKGKWMYLFSPLRCFVYFHLIDTQ